MVGDRHETPMSDLGRRIAHRREEIGLSRDEAARRAGMDAGYLEYLEQSPEAVVSGGAMLRLAVALETSPTSLAGGDVAWPPGRGRAGPHPVLETLTQEQCESRLAPGGVGRVVFCTERGPVALPVNFRFIAGNVVFRTTPTTAVEVTSEPTVSFEVDQIDDAMRGGWSVLVSGKAQSVADPADLAYMASVSPEPWAGGDREVVIRLTIEQISGRCIRQDEAV